MSEHKGALSLIIAVLAIFSIYILFATGVVQPLVSDVGSKFQAMVDSIFTNAGGGNFDDGAGGNIGQGR